MYTVPGGSLMSPPTAAVGPRDRVLPATKILSAVIIPFLIAAYVLLYFWPAPDDTARLFAWRIVPGFTAMVLGSVYLGGSYFFLRAIWANQWHRIAGGFVPIGSFATLMGVATVLHWDKFVHTNLAFRLWAALYFTTPFLVFAVWWANRRERVRPAADGLKVSAGTARLIGLVGVAALATSAFLFLAPSAAISDLAVDPDRVDRQGDGRDLRSGRCRTGSILGSAMVQRPDPVPGRRIDVRADRGRRGSGARRLRRVQAADLGLRRRVRGRGRWFSRALRAHGTARRRCDSMIRRAEPGGSCASGVLTSGNWAVARRTAADPAAAG